MSTAPEAPFTEPWQATAFALTLNLHERGIFSWQQWTAALAAQIARRPDADYYACWLAALETLLTSTGHLDASEIDRLQHAWQKAAEHTPHGQPITLESGVLDDSR